MRPPPRGSNVKFEDVSGISPVRSNCSPRASRVKKRSSPRRPTIATVFGALQPAEGNRRRGQHARRLHHRVRPGWPRGRVPRARLERWPAGRPDARSARRDAQLVRRAGHGRPAPGVRSAHRKKRAAHGRRRRRSRALPHHAPRRRGRNPPPPDDVRACRRRVRRRRRGTRSRKPVRDRAGDGRRPARGSGTRRAISPSADTSFAGARSRSRSCR